MQGTREHGPEHGMEPRELAWIIHERAVLLISSPALQGWVCRTKRFTARFSGLPGVGFPGPSRAGAGSPPQSVAEAQPGKAVETAFRYCLGLLTPA